MIRPVEPKSSECCFCHTGNAIIDAVYKLINNIFIKMVQADNRRNQTKEETQNND